MGLEDKFRQDNEILKDTDTRSNREDYLRKQAQQENSEIYCPNCNINLPDNSLTAVTNTTGVDKSGKPVFETRYYCPTCQSYFDKQ